MLYHRDSAVDRLVLAVINDGDGSMCGMTYAERCARAVYGLADFYAAVDEMDRVSVERFDTPPTPRDQRRVAARLVQDYYRRHVAELAAQRGRP